MSRMRRAQNSRSKARTVEGAAHRRARIAQGGAEAPAAREGAAMGAVNVAIEVAKEDLEVALGSGGELFSERNQPRAIARLSKRLAELGCARRGCRW